MRPDIVRVVVINEETSAVVKEIYIYEDQEDLGELSYFLYNNTGEFKVFIDHYEQIINK